MFSILIVVLHLYVISISENIINWWQVYRWGERGGNQQTQVCNNIASLLKITPADIKTFLGMLEPQDNSTNNVKERTGVYLVQ